MGYDKSEASMQHINSKTIAQLLIHHLRSIVTNYDKLADRQR